MNLKIAICDDENIICQEIKRQLLSIRTDYEIKIYHSGYELIDYEKNSKLFHNKIRQGGNS